MKFTTPLKLAVIGDPVLHSKSPELHRGFLAEAQLAGTYEAITVATAEVGAALSRFAKQGYHGLNVTTPLKEAVLPFTAERDATVKLIDAANTLIYDVLANRWNAANTDGAGAVSAMEQACAGSLRAKRILVLGVGPTGRSAAVALIRAGAEVSIWNRTTQRAAAFAERCGAELWSNSGRQPEAVLSTLPPNPAISEEILSVLQRSEVVVDANYGPRATLGNVLKRDIFTGESMLAAQARESFRLWCEVFA